MDAKLTDPGFSLEIAARQQLKTTHRLHGTDQPSLQMDLARRNMRIHLSIGADHQEFRGFNLTGEMTIDLDRKIVAELSGDRRIGEKYGSWRCSLNE